MTVPATAEIRATAALADALGADCVVTDDAARRFAAADFSDRILALPVAVVRPLTREQVAETLAICRRHSLSVTVRGGGMSYTLAHLPKDSSSVVIDVSGLNRVVEMNAADRYVVVEPGVTWAQLAQELAGTGLWMPALGTLSGLHATVGGGLSQQACGVGQGFLTDYVLGLEVVLGDGRTVRTGSWAAPGTAPFLREFGPDLSGLFLCDSGAMGVKTAAVLRLDPLPGGTSFGCFSFSETEQLVAAMTEIGGTGLAGTCVGSDAYANAAFAHVPMPSAAEVRDLAVNVLRSGTSRWRSARQLTRAVRPGGLGALAKVPNLLSYAADSTDSRAADRAGRILARIARRHGGRSVSTALSIGMRHAPFQPVHALMFGPRDDSTVPSNALYPLSGALPAYEALQQFWAENSRLIEEHDLRISHNLLLMRHVFGIEPIIYWPDRPAEYRLAHASPGDQERLAQLPAHPEAQAAAADLRARMLTRLRSLGCAHIQLGKVYDYREAMSGSASWQLLEQIKSTIDPDAMLNPGALGLS